MSTFMNGLAPQAILPSQKELSLTQDCGDSASGSGDSASGSGDSASGSGDSASGSGDSECMQRIPGTNGFGLGSSNLPAQAFPREFPVSLGDSIFRTPKTSGGPLRAIVVFPCL